MCKFLIIVVGENIFGAKKKGVLPILKYKETYLKRKKIYLFWKKEVMEVFNLFSHSFLRVWINSIFGKSCTFNLSLNISESISFESVSGLNKFFEGCYLKKKEIVGEELNFFFIMKFGRN